MKAFGRNVVVLVLGLLLGALASSQLARGQAPEKFDGTFGHVAVVVRDADKAAKAFADVFGVTVPPPRIIRNIPFPPSYGTATMSTKTTSFMANGVRLEIIEPLDASPWRDFLNKNGEGVHHLAFTVPDFKSAVQRLQDKGGKWVQGTEATNFGYIDLTPVLGFTVEVVGAGGAKLPPQ